LDPPVSLVWIENTHVYSGGSVVTPAAVDTLHAGIAPAGIPLHLDGSRIFNAAAVIGTDARSLSGKVDTVSISLNTGLAAPLGAILAGPAPFIKEAVRVRQLFGGGWRPATIPAAAGIVALETMIPRLADDHRRARRLGEGLAGRDGIACEPGR